MKRSILIAAAIALSMSLAQKAGATGNESFDRAEYFTIMSDSYRYDYHISRERDIVDINPRIETTLAIGDGVYMEVSPSINFTVSRKNEFGVGFVANFAQLGTKCNNYGAFFAFRHTAHPDRAATPFFAFKSGFTGMTEAELRSTDQHGYRGHFHDWKIGYCFDLGELKVDLGIGRTKKRYFDAGDRWNDRFTAATIGIWF